MLTRGLAVLFTLSALALMVLVSLRRDDLSQHLEDVRTCRQAGADDPLPDCRFLYEEATVARLAQP
jgi:hypothetical protein